MNRIEQKFAELKQKGQKALVTFITAGDPSLDFTEKLIPTLEQSGVDLLELGVPFSDPMADGPVIQRSSERALSAGATLDKILHLVQRVRKKSQLPILLMGYYNPILTYGVERFFRDAQKAGVDGALIVDLPPEEGQQARQAAQKFGLSLIFLLAPTSDPQRIRVVTAQGSGFIYYVSLTGITGANLNAKLSNQRALKMLNKSSKLPVCVGFGIKTPAQAKAAARMSDGVVVGSALVKILEDFRGNQALAKLRQLVSRLATSVHSVS